MTTTVLPQGGDPATRKMLLLALEGCASKISRGNYKTGAKLAAVVEDLEMGLPLEQRHTMLIAEVADSFLEMAADLERLSTKISVEFPALPETDGPALPAYTTEGSLGIDDIPF